MRDTLAYTSRAVRRDLRHDRRHRQRLEVGLQLGPRALRDVGRARCRQRRREDEGRRGQAGRRGSPRCWLPATRPSTSSRPTAASTTTRPPRAYVKEPKTGDFPGPRRHQAGREEGRLRQQGRLAGRHRRRHRLRRVPLRPAAADEPDRRQDHGRHVQGRRDRREGLPRSGHPPPGRELLRRRQPADDPRGHPGQPVGGHRRDDQASSRA